ncbi:MAG: hypothetical protein Unbinned8699contig1000_56 [Prokaryotic dsDNA virus sp.]|nr:hypothetical protein [Marinobacter sp.]QDP58663.1 MAG: hypothetical protein Unbinned8699contig1000_56 [Prokaryotic dsDNA virus sp.]|tara:strand:+ start:2738 stop:4378 length:1641 start_codon:yes stop_codon:yes gene_type:complete
MTTVNVSSLSGRTVQVSYLGAYTAALSISSADNITSEGQTATFTLANNSGAPTGATLSGTDVGTLTLVSGSTYSYTPPLLPDDATADLVVSVDSTTVSTQISYANSYPYVLTNHGTPQPNSVMEGNQFGSTQPVELKVITDTDAAIADIDWQAMSDNQQWLTDIRNASSVTSVADGSTSFTLGYYVQETGATGTFERTVTTTDTLSPAIDSVSVPTAGTYHAGDVLSFTVNWNENVTVTGTPALNLSIGGSARQANYASGSTTAALVFTYTVQAGDVDADGIAVSNLSLDGGTIQDGAGNDAYLTLNSVGDTSGVLVDADAALIQSVAVPTAGTYVPGNSLDFTVTFEAAVTVTGTPELLIDVGGEQKSSAYVSGSTTTALLFRYTVASGDLDTDGIGVSSLSLAGGTIKDQYSVDANLALNSVADTSGVLVDGVGPAISVNPLTTLDTSPIVSGSAGDATSLTLVVTGVGTYNPTPSGGSWSQQLPTLALGDYPMTLNGQDANGNAAVEASATLRVVDEMVTTPRGLFQPLFRSLTGPVNQTLFR